MDRPKTQDLAVEDFFMSIDLLLCKYMDKGMDVIEAMSACYRALELHAEEKDIPMDFVTEIDD